MSDRSLSNAQSYQKTSLQARKSWKTSSFSSSWLQDMSNQTWSDVFLLPGHQRMSTPILMQACMSG